MSKTRQERRALTAHKVQQRLQQHEILFRYNGDQNLPTPQQKGRMCNHSPFDCGNPKCGLCGRDKRKLKYVNTKDTLTIQEKRAALYWNDYRKHGVLNDLD